MRHCLKYIFLPLVFALLACENEAYDTGDGPLSGMRADFVEALTDADAHMASVETDDGERLFLTDRVTVGWMERPDTVYRALLYYNKVEADGGAFLAEPLGITQVLVPPVTGVGDMNDDLKADPLDFVSSWKSANGKYLNLELGVKTGTVDGSYGTQTLGLVCLGVDERADGTRLVRIALYHDQAGVPQYYTATAYLSIAASRLPIEPTEGDEVSIDIETYSGTLTRTFTF